MAAAEAKYKEGMAALERGNKAYGRVRAHARVRTKGVWARL